MLEASTSGGSATPTPTEAEKNEGDEGVILDNLIDMPLNKKNKHWKKKKMCEKIVLCEKDLWYEIYNIE